jgi:hypothetical protein
VWEVWRLGGLRPFMSEIVLPLIRVGSAFAAPRRLDDPPLGRTPEAPPMCALLPAIYKPWLK